MALHTTQPVVAQVWRGGSRQARLAASLKTISIHPLDDGRPIGQLLAQSKASDAVDAHVVIPGDLMPQSIQEILDHADELAERFEDYEPEPGDERPAEEYLLERATLARARGERQILDAVIAARAKGISWQRIGELLGTSAQAARQPYGAVIETG